jgi:hypothetical protein
LEGLQPSKNHPFLVLVVGVADNQRQKNEDFGEAMPPHTHHRVSRVNKAST